MKYIPEPFKIKMVEPIKVTSREERAEILARAHYNMFGLPAESVYIDLLTDSGTGAMSDAQWAAMMRGDEAYSGGRSYVHLMDVAGEIIGYDYLQPVHQGRAAEKVLIPLLVSRRGQIVVANTFFDTTRAHVGLAGARPVDNVCQEGLDSAKAAPFKGNMDIPGLEKLISKHGDNVAAIFMTVTNNSVGGQPVSLKNMRETYELAHENGIPVCLDAARYAENAWFIHEREDGCQERSLRDIAREMFSYGDMFVMSAKKDGIVNMGGMVGVRDDGELIAKVKSNVISFEGYLTYGGLSGRDLEALAVGLEEGLAPDWQRYRVGQIQYLGDKLQQAGVPFQNPVGGHAVFIDAGRLLPHLKWNQYPGHALATQLYLEAGIRSCDIGSYLMDRDSVTHEEQQAPFEFTRLAVPRRVYTQSHMDLIAEALADIAHAPEKVPGFRITWEPPVLRHFTSRLEPIG